MSLCSLKCAGPDMAREEIDDDKAAPAPALKIIIVMSVRLTCKTAQILRLDLGEKQAGVSNGFND